MKQLADESKRNHLVGSLPFPPCYRCDGVWRHVLFKSFGVPRDQEHKKWLSGSGPQWRVRDGGSPLLLFSLLPYSSPPLSLCSILSPPSLLSPSSLSYFHVFLSGVRVFLQKFVEHEFKSVSQRRSLGTRLLWAVHRGY